MNYGKTKIDWVYCAHVMRDGQPKCDYWCRNSNNTDTCHIFGESNNSNNCSKYAEIYPNKDFISNQTTTFILFGESVSKSYAWYAFPGIIFCLLYVIVMIIASCVQNQRDESTANWLNLSLIWIWNLFAALVTLYVSYRMWQYTDQQYSFANIFFFCPRGSFFFCTHGFFCVFFL